MHSEKCKCKRKETVLAAPPIRRYLGREKSIYTYLNVVKFVMSIECLPQGLLKVPFYSLPLYGVDVPFRFHRVVKLTSDPQL